MNYGTKTANILTIFMLHGTKSYKDFVRGYNSQISPNFIKTVNILIFPSYTCRYCLLCMYERPNSKNNEKGVSFALKYST